MATERPKPRRAPGAAVLSTYVPRRCGLATFARDLVKSYGGSRGVRLPIVAMSKVRGETVYPAEVVYEIQEDVTFDYRTAAEFLDRCSCEIVSIQHEFGIFGGEDGSHILELLENLRKPAVVTLHTVLPSPTPGQKEVLQQVCASCASVVVLAESALPILRDVYGVSEEKITYIPHGGPDLPFSDAAFFQESLGLAGMQVVMTFGLLSPSKGIEMGLRAIAKVAEEFPNIVYLVVGATHPELVKKEGEAYREKLDALAKELGVLERVRFVNKYLTERRLLEYLQGADVYLSPYQGADQIASGTLSFAVAAGKAVVATPYAAARELLAQGRGIVTPFDDAEAMANSVRDLLRDASARVKIRKAAYRHGRSFTWSKVGAAYRRLFGDIASGNLISAGMKLRSSYARPELRWDHLFSLTDETGVLQHATHHIPNWDHGYCTDDNARALLAACKEWQQNKDREILPLLRKTLSFLSHGFDPASGRMRNFLSYDRTWQEGAGSEDCHGRSIWAAGMAVAFAPQDADQQIAFKLFQSLLPKLKSSQSPRPWAFAVLGIAAYLSRFGGDLGVRRLGTALAERLAALYEQNRTRHWCWYEPLLTYDNARLPEAMLSASRWSSDSRFRTYGLESLEWLFSVLTDPKGHHISLVGSHGWWRKGRKRARFDQQPVDAAAMVSAAKLAYELTANDAWRSRMEAAHEWFLGRNDTGLVLIDAATGGCGDGLTPTGVNANMGAESALSWILASQDVLAEEARREDAKFVGKGAAVKVASVASQ